MQAASIDNDSIDGVVPINWSEGVKRTKYACKECSEHNADGDICFLCKEHFSQFHGYTV